MAPELAFSRFLWSLAVGAGVGAVYDFWRPLGEKHPHLADVALPLGFLP